MDVFISIAKTLVLYAFESPEILCLVIMLIWYSMKLGVVLLTMVQKSIWEIFKFMLIYSLLLVIILIVRYLTTSIDDYSVGEYMKSYFDSIKASIYTFGANNMTSSKATSGLFYWIYNAYNYVTK